MPSIEEAWVELAWEEAECFHERSGATDRDHVATKARALAESVLESVEMYIIDDAVVEAARARIERLGK